MGASNMATVVKQFTGKVKLSVPKPRKGEVNG